MKSNIETGAQAPSDDDEFLHDKGNYARQPLSLDKLRIETDLFAGRL